MRSIIATIALSLAVIGQSAVADVTSRSGGPSASVMTARSNSETPDGLAMFRPVLSGVLYRAGFKGGDKGRTGLSSAQRSQLCNMGFSQAYYADFGKNTDFSSTSCGGNALTYSAARSSRPASVMKAIHDVVKKPASGPVVVHCMWGVHSSGALSAMALVQFCDWSEDRAKRYWDDARNGAPCSGGCDKWIDAKFEKFKKDPSLTISAAEKAAICPK